MSKVTAELTDVNSQVHRETALSKLNFRQRAAVRALAGGKSVSQAARDSNLSRTAVSGWLNHNIDFQRALHELQRELYSDVPQNEAAAFRAAESTAVLSLAGIRARVQLLDQLLLRDLKEQSEKRTRLIRQLQASIAAAGDYLSKLDSDEVARDIVEYTTTEYRRLLLEAVSELLKPLDGGEELLDRFSKKLRSIDSASGVER